MQALTDTYLETRASEDLDLGAILKDQRLGRFALLSSFGAESVVMIHLVTSLARETPVLFLDTGQHFPETLEYVEHLKSSLGLNLHIIKPNPDLTLSEDPEKTLHKSNPNNAACCANRCR